MFQKGPSPPPDGGTFPDLLHAVPSCRLDVAATDSALLFAFAGSGTDAVFVDALSQATLAPSTWEPASYVEELFIASLLRACFAPTVAGREQPAVAMSHLLRVITSPPEDLDTIEFRRTILAELLASPGLRHSLASCYGSLGRFRILLEGTSASGRIDPNRRQLEVLGAFRDVIEEMSTSFDSAHSGLLRMRTFAKRVQESEPYRSLADLLRYDDRMATVSFRVKIGADGRVRGLELLSATEDQENPFVSSPWRRWKAKFELLFRGYSFGDGEVMARLIDAVYEGIRAEFVALVQLFGDLEFFLGALTFRDRAQAAGLAVCLPTFVPRTSARQLHGLFNPLLLASGIKPVPCDIATDRHDSTVLITGPNSGGKTRLLQSIGLSQLLGQSGLFVPAASAEMALASGLLVSLVQHTAVDQTEGRLGIELMRIRSLFERLPVGAVVLLDELCSGTNPSEGEEIFELVLQVLDRLGPQAFITTHFLRFASRLERDRPIDKLRFLQVDLGEDRQPTYQFGEGVATTSLAAQAAARLGVTGEQLLSLIEARIAES